MAYACARAWVFGNAFKKRWMSKCAWYAWSGWECLQERVCGWSHTDACMCARVFGIAFEQECVDGGTCAEVVGNAFEKVFGDAFEKRVGNAFKENGVEEEMGEWEYLPKESKEKKY